MFAQQAGALEMLAKALKCGDAEEKEDTPAAKVNDETQSMHMTASPAPAKTTAAKAKRKAPETKKTPKASAKKPRQAVKQTPPPAKKMLARNHYVACKICGNGFDHWGAKRDAEVWVAAAGHGAGLLTPPDKFSAFYPCMCGIEVTHFKPDGWMCKGERCHQKPVRTGRAQENGYA